MIKCWLHRFFTQALKTLCSWMCAVQQSGFVESHGILKWTRFLQECWCCQLFLILQAQGTTWKFEIIFQGQRRDHWAQFTGDKAVAGCTNGDTSDEFSDVSVVLQDGDLLLPCWNLESDCSIICLPIAFPLWKDFELGVFCPAVTDTGTPEAMRWGCSPLHAVPRAELMVYCRIIIKKLAL